MKELELGGGDFSKSPPVQPTRLHRRRVLAQAGLASARQVEANVVANLTG